MNIKEYVRQYPEYSEINLDKYNDETILLHFITTRPQSAQIYLTEKINEAEFGFLPTLISAGKTAFDVGKTVINAGKNVIKNIAKKHEIKITPKETPVITAQPTPPQPQPQEKRNIFLYVGIGAILLIAIIIMMKR